MVSAMRAFASAVPVMLAVCSLALTVLSPATGAMVGAFGATVSTVMARVAAAEVLPALSVAVTDSVCAPSPMAVRSAACSVYVHAPWASAVSVRTLGPIFSATVVPASAVPVMAAVCSVALIRSSEATTAIVGVVGAIVSMVTLRVVAGETLPAASDAVADNCAAPCPIARMSPLVSV